MKIKLCLIKDNERGITVSEQLQLSEKYEVVGIADDNVSKNLEGLSLIPFFHLRKVSSSIKRE